MQSLNFSVRAGETVALVGKSGCGKSTCIQLLQRFYDPIFGRIKLGGYNVKDLDVDWLRSVVSVVEQEPVLFNTTISENIKLGNKEATDADIQRVAKEANIHQFISSLPNKYQTMLGETGVKLSGGQKQRIVIASALLGNRPILLLDEATSAMDLHNEVVIQQVLKNVLEITQSFAKLSSILFRRLKVNGL